MMRKASADSSLACSAAPWSLLRKSVPVSPTCTCVGSADCKGGECGSSTDACGVLCRRRKLDDLLGDPGKGNVLIDERSVSRLPPRFRVLLMVGVEPSSEKIRPMVDSGFCIDRRSPPTGSLTSVPPFVTANDLFSASPELAWPELDLLGNDFPDRDSLGVPKAEEAEGRFCFALCRRSSCA